MVSQSVSSLVSDAQCGSGTFDKGHMAPLIRSSPLTGNFLYDTPKERHKQKLRETTQCLWYDIPFHIRLLMPYMDILTPRAHLSQPSVLEPMLEPLYERNSSVLLITVHALNVVSSVLITVHALNVVSYVLITVHALSYVIFHHCRRCGSVCTCARTSTPPCISKVTRQQSSSRTPTQL